MSDMRPLGIGDLVKVLRGARLPREEPLGIGTIERMTRAESGEYLYWVRGFECARTGRELRRVITLTEAWAEQDAERGECQIPR